MYSPYPRDVPIDIPAVGFAEGVYVTWNHLWDVLTLLGGNAVDFFLTNDFGEAYRWCAIDTNFYFYAAGVEALLGAYDRGSLAQTHLYPNYSVLKGYVAMRDSVAITTLRVFDRTGLIFSRNVTLDVPFVNDIYYIAVSPSGEYIGMVCDRAGILDDIVVMYQGA